MDPAAVTVTETVVGSQGQAAHASSLGAGPVPGGGLGAGFSVWRERVRYTVDWSVKALVIVVVPLSSTSVGSDGAGTFCAAVGIGGNGLQGQELVLIVQIILQDTL